MSQHLIGRTLAGLAVVATVAVVAGPGTDAAPVVQRASSSESRPAMPAWSLKPCASEDSVNCRWDADTAGNGKGHSFIVREFPGKAHMVCVMYVKRADARRWDYCEATR